MAFDQGCIGEVRLFAGNFAPRNWAFCHGQLLAISSNTALFSILGTTYGGDGRTTFGLPDLRGRTAVGQGTGPGLSTRNLGSTFGAETTTLNATNLPPTNLSGSVSIPASEEDATQDDPNGAVLGVGNFYAPANTASTQLGSPIPVNVNLPGGGQAMNNMPPSIGLNYVICLLGIYPSRS